MKQSPITGSHSKGLSQKIGVMADYYGFDSEKKTRLMIAADLHDVGKLVIPSLMACMDIYQALTESRPYREGLSHQKAGELLTSIADKGHISREITADILEHCAEIHC